MNFKGIKRAEELRLNIEKQDKEIIELEKLMYNLATENGQTLSLTLSVSNPSVKFKKSEGGYPSGGEKIETPYGTGYVLDVKVGGFSGIFEATREVEDNERKERIQNKILGDKKTFALTNGMALEFLQIYHRRLVDERALAFKLLEECIKALKVLD